VYLDFSMFRVMFDPGSIPSQPRQEMRCQGTIGIAGRNPEDRDQPRWTALTTAGIALKTRGLMIDAVKGLKASPLK
jgi:hypothetical protein